MGIGGQSMNRPVQFESLLVPMDFSSASEIALKRAIELSCGADPVLILLHVIDTSLVEFATTHEWGSEEQVIARMRERAKRKLECWRERASERGQVDVVVSEGQPFLEILQKAEDFAVDAIVIGTTGTRGAIDKLLFGSTAEKVIRGSRFPVIVLPTEE